jgi:hypothetical protein
MESLDIVSNNLFDILYHLHTNLKLDIKDTQSKRVLTKARLALRDLEKIKNNLSVVKSV